MSISDGFVLMVIDFVDVIAFVGFIFKNRPILYKADTALITRRPFPVKFKGEIFPKRNQMPGLGPVFDLLLECNRLLITR